MDRRNSKSSGSSVSDDAIEMTAMSVETASHVHDVESANTDTCKPASWFSCECLTKSSLADFLSYVGVRGVALIVLLKIITVIAFAFFLMGGSSISRDADFSGVTLVSGRPENLRELIHEATKKALFVSGPKKALFTMGTQNELVYDNYIEFIVSYPSTPAQESTPISPASEQDSTESGEGDNWAAEKDKVSTISTSSTPAEIAATRALDRDTGKDPLSLDVVDDMLVVHRFALPADQQQGAGSTAMSGSAVTVPKKQQFTILLNKFNTVKDHCLIVSDSFAPQVAPFRGYELELWHWVLLQTRGVGFYNSNLLAGASQAHRHMQFIPGDEIWSLRNPDATHVLPIDDVIMPRIESGRWAAFPYSTGGITSTREVSTTAGAVGGSADATADKFIYTAAAGSDKSKSNAGKGAANDKSESFQKRYKGAFMHQLPQFDFQHAVAVLQDRSSFLQYSGNGRALKAYSDYLQQVYEALLLVNDIDIETLRACAEAETDPQATTGSNPDVNCLEAAGYNLIMRPQYMMLVPRGKKNFAGTVNVNSFGYLGMFLATKDVARELIKDVGPLSILKAVSREKTNVLKN